LGYQVSNPTSIGENPRGMYKEKHMLFRFNVRIEAMILWIIGMMNAHFLDGQVNMWLHDGRDKPYKKSKNV